jgi:hypothetical protein
VGTRNLRIELQKLHDPSLNRNETQEGENQTRTTHFSTFRRNSKIPPLPWNFPDTPKLPFVPSEVPWLLPKPFCFDDHSSRKLDDRRLDATGLAELTEQCISILASQIAVFRFFPRSASETAVVDIWFGFLPGICSGTAVVDICRLSLRSDRRESPVPCNLIRVMRNYTRTLAGCLHYAPVLCYMFVLE